MHRGMNESLGYRVFSAVHKVAARKLLRAIPVVGAVVAATYAYRNVREKGLKRGAIDTALDMTPVVGRIKAVTELVTGDLIPPPPVRVREDAVALPAPSG